MQGRGSGELWVYAADTGKVLKTIQTGSHIMAAPISYAIGSEQYVAVQVGYRPALARSSAESLVMAGSAAPDFLDMRAMLRSIRVEPPRTETAGLPEIRATRNQRSYPRTRLSNTRPRRRSERPGRSPGRG